MEQYSGTFMINCRSLQGKEDNLSRKRLMQLRIQVTDSNLKQYSNIIMRTCTYSTITNTIQYNTIQYNTIQYYTIQYYTIQYYTIQYNTIQYNTIQCNLLYFTSGKFFNLSFSDMPLVLVLVLLLLLFTLSLLSTSSKAVCP